MRCFKVVVLGAFSLLSVVTHSVYAETGVWYNCPSNQPDLLIDEDAGIEKGSYRHFKICECVSKRLLPEERIALMLDLKRSSDRWLRAANAQVALTTACRHITALEDSLNK